MTTVILSAGHDDTGRQNRDQECVQSSIEIEAVKQ
jgi:hypothetical protein